MGIRFLCPNGHKLNVKGYLAGKRGICPQCDVKFLVPTVSGGMAVEADESEEVESTPSVDNKVAQKVDAPLAAEAQPAATAVVPPPVPSSAAPPAPSVADEPAVLWYVRMASGEQFGPADTEVMQGWVAEGRVPADSWAWRTGWADWKSGREAVAFLNEPTASVADQPASLPTAIALAPTAMPVNDIETDTAAGNTSATVRYQLSKRNREARARMVTFVLGGLVVLLIAVLIFVLLRS